MIAKLKSSKFYCKILGHKWVYDLSHRPYKQVCLHCDKVKHNNKKNDNRHFNSHNELGI